MKESSLATIGFLKNLAMSPVLSLINLSFKKETKNKNKNKNKFFTIIKSLNLHRQFFSGKTENIAGK